MDLYDIATPLTKMSREDVVLFVRELRFQRTQDHSPPKKEKKARAKKTSKKTEDLLKALFSDPEQRALFISEIEKWKENEPIRAMSED